MNLEQAKKLFLNKNVIVRLPNGKTVGGLLTFLGPNEYLNWPLQATVARGPFQIDSLDDISLRDDRRILPEKKSNGK